MSECNDLCCAVSAMGGLCGTGCVRVAGSVEDGPDTVAAHVGSVDVVCEMREVREVVGVMVCVH